MNFISRLKERYRDSWIILKELVKNDFRLRYQGSFLGIAWSVLKPIMLFCVMYVVFVRFLRMSDGTPSFPLVLLLGISLWNFFGEATNMGLSSIVDRGDLLRKVNFPKYIIVISSSINAFICLLINFGVVLVAMFITGLGDITWNVLWLPLNVLQLYILALGVALLLSTAYVYFRDVKHIWEVIMQALFYATPIIYPLAMVEEKLGGIGLLLEKLMLLNPAAQVIQDIRHNLIAPATTPTVWTLSDNLLYQLAPVALTVVLFLLGVHLFRKHSAKFAEVL